MSEEETPLFMSDEWFIDAVAESIVHKNVASILFDVLGIELVELVIPRHQSLAKKLLKIYSKVKYIPSVEKMLQYYSNKLSDDEIELLKAIDSIQPSEDEAFIIKCLSDAIHTFKARNMVVDYVDYITGNKITSYEAFEKHLVLPFKDFASKVNINNNVVDVCDMTDIYEENNIFESDLEILDSRIGGWESGCLYAIVAPSNMGKTMTCVHIGCGFLRKGHKVLYINMEDRPKAIKTRLYCNHMNVTKDEILNGSLKGKEQEVSDFFKDDFILLNLDADTSISVIELEINKVIMQGFNPDVIIVDQLSKIDYPSMHQMNSYDKYGKITDRLKTFAMKKNVCMITPVQSNRNGFGGRVTEKEVADSMKILHNADCVLFLSQLAEEVPQKLIHIYVGKSRSTSPEERKDFYIKVNYGYQKLYNLTEEECKQQFGQMYGPEREEKYMVDPNKMKKVPIFGSGEK